MKEQLIEFETAKLAKEKGFEEYCHSYYFEDSTFKEFILTGTNGYYGEEYEFELEEFTKNWNDKWLTKKNGDRCFGCKKKNIYFETFSAPTQSLLQKWLREKHNLDVIPIRIRNSSIYYSDIQYPSKPYYSQCSQYTEEQTDADYNNTLIYSFEKTLEKGLQEALELINN